MTSYLRSKLTQADEVVVEMRGGSESRAKALLDETKDLGFKSRRIIKKEGHDQFDIERDDGDPGNWPDNGGDGTCLASFGGEGEYAGPAQQCGYDSEGNYVPLPPSGFFPLPNPVPVPAPGPVLVPLPI